MISLVAPYWNRPEALAKSLALMALQYPTLDLDVIVVDDGSSQPPLYDGPYPWPVTVVQLPRKAEPKNPCVPINAGVAAAKGDFIVISNPEVLHTAPVLPAMRDELAALGPNGYVMAATWCPDESAWHCHSTLDPNRFGIRQPAGSGFHFCAMLNRSLWDRAGGFDEDYRDGAGWDDPDWVNRLERAGARFRIRDDLVVTHPKEGARTAWPPGAFERNRQLFLTKWPQ